MSSERPPVPEYGGTGDYIGARRGRRAFRLCVLACVFMAVMLWFSERFLSLDSAERLYRSALTMQAPSARPLLRSAVKIDEETNEFPTSKYVEALAVREEEDRILDTYAKAYKLSPDNAALAMRYGCCLLREGKAQEAVKRFQEAAVHAPTNALPMYLEAAAVLKAGAGDDPLGVSLALVAEANGSGKKVSFPRPLWFAGMPQEGMWYARLRRDIADIMLAPLETYFNKVIKGAAESIERRRMAHWDSWLGTLQTMGERIADSSEPGAPQALAGIHLQLQAVDLRLRIRELRNMSPGEALLERRQKLQDAKTLLQDFENSRDARIKRDADALAFPLELIGRTLFSMAVVYIFAAAAARFMGADTRYWTVPHMRFTQSLLLAAAAFFVVILAQISVAREAAPTAQATMYALGMAWWVVFVGVLAFGVFYPAFALPRPAAVCQRQDSAHSAEPADVGQCYRRTYVALMRRFYGILGGLLLCGLSVWVVGYRVIVALYPWDLALATTGLTAEEVQAVRQALQLLSG